MSSVLILGENKSNKQIAAYFREKGFRTETLEDTGALRTFSGEPGAFRAALADGELEADFVVLTQQPESVPADIDGGRPRSLYEAGKLENIADSDRLTPLVFLLDYYTESPLSATMTALACAKALAEKKRKVTCFAKFVRTAGRGAEDLYREARNAGVTFVKYEELSVTYDDSDGAFTIHACDGVLETDVTTKYVYADGGRAVGEAFAAVTEKLRLRPDEDGYLVEDRFYLGPVKTSRRGV